MKNITEYELTLVFSAETSLEEVDKIIKLVKDHSVEGSLDIEWDGLKHYLMHLMVILKQSMFLLLAKLPKT